ncbi:MAG: LCP family protein [Chloroflexota bacterium]
MSGSGGNRQIGLGLLVPVAVLVLPFALLITSLLNLPAGVSPASAATPTAVAAAVPVPPAAAVPRATAAEDLVPVADLPTPEPTFEAAVVAAIKTRTPVTPELTPRPTATPRETWSGPPTFTFVALGVDQRNAQEIPRTDTIMIGQVDLRRPSVNLVSIPRDLLIEIPGYGKDRINAAYVYGEMYKEPGGGIGLLQRTIEKNFGVTIDHFGMVDFQCFRTAVDAVGGVTVDVPRAIVDPKYPTEDYGTKVVRFEPGVQKMDGERALEYARTRSADNDFHRMQRQQLIVSAMREQLLQLRTLPAIPSLIGGCRNMRSDLGWREYLNLATSMRSLDSKSVSFAAINEKMVVDSTLSSGAAVLLPRWDVIRPMIGERFNPDLSRPGAAASPAPALPGASPYPQAAPSPGPFATPQPSPVPRDGSVAGPPLEVLPGDALTPVLLPIRRT